MSKKYTPEIARVLTLSTSHVTRDDQGLLLTRTWPCIAASEFQALFPTDEWAENSAGSDYSPALIRLLSHARHQGCSLLRLHADGPVNPRLPVFE